MGKIILPVDFELYVTTMSIQDKFLTASITLMFFLIGHSWPATANGQEPNSDSAVGPAEKPKAKSSEKDAQPPAVIVVQGIGGNDEYQKAFSEAAEHIKSAAGKSKADFHWIGKPAEESGVSDLKRLEEILQKASDGKSELWLILIGHGTFDKKQAKFNLRGADLTAKQLNLWLKKTERPTVVVNCSSASAPFLNELSEQNRIVITATRSGFEISYSRFGLFFAKAIGDQRADIDKDEQVSVLEAFLYASKQVNEFYASQGRLVSEHALVDDNGDQRGTPADFYRGVRVAKKVDGDAKPDGNAANRVHLILSDFEQQLSAEFKSARSKLENEIDQLRLQKSKLEEDDYYQKLENRMFQLSELYHQAELKTKPDENSTSDNKASDNKASDNKASDNKADDQTVPENALPEKKASDTAPPNESKKKSVQPGPAKSPGK